MLNNEVQNLIENLKFSSVRETTQFPIPNVLKSSFEIILNFFCSNIGNKICLVYPAKELTAQWLSVPLVLLQIQNDYKNYSNGIFDSYKGYSTGDKLILNNKAIVEWLGIREKQFRGPTFKTIDGAEITIRISDILSLQKVPDESKPLSPLKKVRKYLTRKDQTPLEKLLSMELSGNTQFIKSRTCLISKYRLIDQSKEDIRLNFMAMNEYFQDSKIDETGTSTTESPILISNNLTNLSLFISSSSANSISRIIIDGFSTILERGTDFSDIDVRNIPTILITDLSEIESFETISNYGFEFFNFTKESLKLDHSANLSPFQSFEEKLRKYISFKVVKEICQDAELEATSQIIHSIEKDESNNDLTKLKICLIQLINLVSRIAHILTKEDISVLNCKMNSIETLFSRSKMWLGDSHQPIQESIPLLKSVIARFESQPSEKCTRLKNLISSKQYDYIICYTEEEAKTLDNSLPTHIQKPRVITVADVNDKLLSHKPQKAILAGWVKSKNIDRILSSFLFSELTVLFYQFENKYYHSLQRKNRQHSENIKATISNNGNRLETNPSERKGFDDFYSSDEAFESTSAVSFDIVEYELTLDNAQYSHYAAKGDLSESIKTKRIVFESDSFIYTTETHKFLVINELIEREGEIVNLHLRRVESLQIGDVIALINTDRDILVELVEKHTNSKELASVKRWTELWKNLLKEYYFSIGSDFKQLVEALRKNDCKKHEVTIRTWLQDESRIGPNDDADLISIAQLTKSDLLRDNIKKVRESIKIMKGWRHDASDFIIGKIKAEIHQFTDSSVINKKISIEGLGSVIILKVVEVSNTWETIDVKYVNRLLQKEII